MLNKLNLIFERFGFDIKYNDDNLKIFKRLGTDKSEFFITIELTELSGFFEKQSRYVKLLKDNIKDKEVDKNSTLLICLKSDSLPLNPDIYKEILKIEEDPYYFRKLVLPYTQEQVSHLDNTDEFEEIIKSPTKFEEFKEECKTRNLSNSQYEIISQLYIKLPFLKLPIVSNVKNIVLDEYKASLNVEENKALTFLETIEIEEIIEHENFFKKLEEL